MRSLSKIVENWARHQQATLHKPAKPASVERALSMRHPQPPYEDGLLRTVRLVAALEACDKPLSYSGTLGPLEGSSEASRPGGH